MQVGLAFDGAAFKAEMEKRIAALRKAQRFAVNTLAFGALRDVQAEMDRVFDRPTPWIRRSMRVIKAGGVDAEIAGRDRQDAEAVIDWKGPESMGAGQDQKGRPGADTLRPQIEGGGRDLKRFERLLQSAGILPQGMVAVPARFAELDRYGNYRRAALVKIISALRAFGEQGFTANKSRERKSRGVRRREDYFAIRGYSNSIKLKPGIYLRGQKGRRPQMVMAFVKAPNYKPRLNPRRVIEESVRANAPAVWAAEAARLQARWGG